MNQQLQNRLAVFCAIISVIALSLIIAYYATVTPYVCVHDQTTDDQLGMVTVEADYPAIHGRNSRSLLVHFAFQPIHLIDRRLRPNVWPDPAPAPASAKNPTAF